jgi:hypothetical protein
MIGKLIAITLICVYPMRFPNLFSLLNGSAPNTFDKRTATGNIQNVPTSAWIDEISIG